VVCGEDVDVDTSALVELDTALDKEDVVVLLSAAVTAAAVDVSEVDAWLVVSVVVGEVVAFIANMSDSIRLPDNSV